MILPVLAQYLNDQGFAKIGKTLFVHQFPEGAVNATLLRRSEAGARINHELPGYRKDAFQAIVRVRDYATGQALADQLMDLLTAYELDLPGYHFKYVRPRTDPVVYPIQASNYIEYSVNLDAVYVIVA